MSVKLNLTSAIKQTKMHNFHNWHMYITTYKESVHYLRRGGGKSRFNPTNRGGGDQKCFSYAESGGGGTTTFKVVFTLA